VPRQASSVKEPFDSPDWMFEGKLDGYRAVTVNLTQPATVFRYWDLVKVRTFGSAFEFLNKGR
jgi:hypothetical protein